MKGSWVGFFHILSLCKVNIDLCKRDSLLTYERWKLLKPTADTKLKLLNVSLEKPVDRSIEEAEPRSVQSQIQDIYFWGSKWALIIFRKILLQASKTRLLPSKGNCIKRPSEPWFLLFWGTRTKSWDFRSCCHNVTQKALLLRWDFIG